jgi:VIT1/CCC1 family predicted Fe2+/Mn2+ transporter
MESRGKNDGYKLRDIILGGQDGLVNVLGVILAVATATQDTRIVIIAGLAATFAESISMAAVAYTSSKSMKDYYNSQLEKEKKEINEMPDAERKEIYQIYKRKGFSGYVLNAIVRKITSNKKLWLRTMMEEELHLNKDEYDNPGKDALIVGFSAIIGSIIPLIPFIIMDVNTGIVTSILFSTVILFITGAVKNKITIGNPIRGGIEIAVIGMAAALIGYGLGAVLGVALYAVYS